MGINNPGFSTVDIGIGIFIAVFCILGFIKGVIRQFFGIVAFIIASISSIVIPHFVKLPIEGSSSVWGYIIFSTLIWIPVFLISNSIGKFISRRMSKKGIRFTDRLWGLAFGGIKGLIIVTLVSFFVDLLPVDSNIFRGSKIVSIIQPYNPLFKIHIMQNLQIIMSSLNDPDYMELLEDDQGWKAIKENESIRLILNDPELEKILAERQFLRFITHPKIQMLIKDKEAMRLLLTTDIDKAVISNI